MALNPEIEKPLISEIPENPEIPLEFEQGISTIATQHTNIPQATNDPSLQITAHPASISSSGPSIILPAGPQVFTRQSKGSTDDTTTWNAWFWLRLIKKALTNHINILVKGQNG